MLKSWVVPPQLCSSLTIPAFLPALVEVKSARQLAFGSALCTSNCGSSIFGKPYIFHIHIYLAIPTLFIHFHHKTKNFKVQSFATDLPTQMIKTICKKCQNEPSALQQTSHSRLIGSFAKVLKTYHPFAKGQPADDPDHWKQKLLYIMQCVPLWVLKHSEPFHNSYVRNAHWLIYTTARVLISGK